jgi:K+-sensing histidine kinase KdpD
VRQSPEATGCRLVPSSCRPADYALLEHQWRTPLTVIKSAAEVLRDHQDLTSSERDQLLEALLAEAARLHASLEAVLSRELMSVGRPPCDASPPR